MTATPLSSALPYAASRQFTDEEIAVECAKWLHLVWCKDAGHSYGGDDIAVANIAVRRIRRLRGSDPLAAPVLADNAQQR